MSEEGPGRDKEYLQLGEAAEVLGVSRFKMSRWVKDGTLPVYRSRIDGRQKLVRRADVMALFTPEPIEGTDDMGKAAA